MEDANVPSVTFSVDTTELDRNAFARLYARHVKKLDLLERYRRRAMLGHDGLGEMIRSIRSRRHRTTLVDVVNELQQQAAASASAFGENHYRTALNRAVAASHPFVQFCLEAP